MRPINGINIQLKNRKCTIFTQDTILNCPNCGGFLDQSIRFCGNCGSAVVATSATTDLLQLITSGVSDKMIRFANDSEEAGTPKANFSNLDDQVVVWAKVKRMAPGEAQVYFSWYSPDGKLYIKSDDPLIVAPSLGPDIYLHTSHKIRDTNMARKLGRWRTEIYVGPRLIDMVYFNIVGDATRATEAGTLSQVETTQTPSPKHRVPKSKQLTHRVPSPVASGRSCVRCGGQIRINAKFCPQCGSPAMLTTSNEVRTIPAPRFCAQCGGRIESTEKFCANCGASTTSTRQSEPRAVTPNVSPVAVSSAGESVIGGYTSTDIGRQGVGIGYGVYITDRRVIGIKKGMLTKAAGGAVAGAVIGGLIGGRIGAQVGSRVLGGKMSTTDSKQLLGDLDKNKDFEAYKQDISFIELKSPGFVGSGHMIIVMKSGSQIPLMLRTQDIHEKLKKLLQTFYPEALRYAS
jgi:predicted amidophosphoribosyltransferase